MTDPIPTPDLHDEGFLAFAAGALAVGIRTPLELQVWHAHLCAQVEHAVAVYPALLATWCDHHRLRYLPPPELREPAALALLVVLLGGCGDSQAQFAAQLTQATHEAIEALARGQDHGMGEEYPWPSVAHGTLSCALVAYGAPGLGVG